MGQEQVGEEERVEESEGVGASKPFQGKDEMNLAEFPLSVIAGRADPNQKTLRFEDRVWDPKRNEMITRKLTITGSDEYGLPTALDDEVCLGLVQLSKMRDFSDRTVPFTRYQLIQILGWRDESKSYERIETSLNRWIGVTLYYENAWRDKKNQSWVDEKFHIIDNVTLYDRDKASALRAVGEKVPPLSSFTWNDVIFRSFSAGNLKSLDFDFYKRLDSAIAKRLYRFLDKRFYLRSSWEFDLKEVSQEHIGLSRNHDAANLKRKLLPAIRELERSGFLHPLTEEQRFQKVRSGDWKVRFERAKASRGEEQRVVADESGSKLCQALVERGVTPSTAQQTVSKYAAQKIEAQLEVFDWLKGRGDPRVSKNPAGFLISAIKSEYLPPKGFLGREEQERREAKAAERRQQAEERMRLAEERERMRQAARHSAISGYFASLSDNERSRIESEAIAQATPIQHDVLKRGGVFAEAAKQSLLDSYVLQILQQAA